MRGNIARFIVDTHCHMTTLYQPGTPEGWKKAEEGQWNGLDGEVAPFENYPLTMYDMDRYGVDMAILLPSVPGTFNETQAKLAKRFPNRFRACCSDLSTLLQAMRGGPKWTLKAAIEEVDAALRTGNYVGIGELPPGTLRTRRFPIPGCEGPVGFEQRVEELSAVCELALKYDVPVMIHDQSLFDRDGKWTLTQLLVKLSELNPKAKIIQTHGAVEGEEKHGLDAIREMYTVLATLPNIYMQTGGWCEKQFEVAFEVGITANKLMWGHDYGNVPQHILRKNIEKYGPKLKCFEYRNTVSELVFRGWDLPAVPTYQPDFYGWGLRTIDRVGDWLTQDEINLILGGTAAKLFRLPVPHSRMFAEGRKDIFGDAWRESIPFIPREQIQYPDPEDLTMTTSVYDWKSHKPIK